MNKVHIILTLTLILIVRSAAFAQDEQQPVPAPVPAAGQDANALPTVSENPPISAIDQPGLDRKSVV